MEMKLGSAGYSSTGGSVCALCGQWIPVGGTHVCSSLQPATYSLAPLVIDPALVSSLERIASALERIADRIH